MSANSAMPSGEGKIRANREDGITVAEWIVAGLGAFLVLGSVSFLLHKALFTEPRPPELTAEVTAVLVQGSGSLVMAEVRNLGGQTVAELTVAAVASGVEKEATIDFVPADSSRMVGFHFEGAVTPSAVELEIGSFREP